MTREDSQLLRRAAEIGSAYLDSVAERPVGSRADLAALRAAFGGPLPERGEDAAAVLERLASAADPGIVATAGPRYFGFVVGGAVPVADWHLRAPAGEALPPLTDLVEGWRRSVGSYDPREQRARRTPWTNPIAAAGRLAVVATSTGAPAHVRSVGQPDRRSAQRRSSRRRRKRLVNLENRRE